jgi:hypothetical protein
MEPTITITFATAIEEHLLETNAGKQPSQAATDV